jgi:hypothetical protein
MEVIVAHKTHFQITAEFEFKPIRSNWTQNTATVLGWQLPSGTTLPSVINASIDSGPLGGKIIQFSKGYSPTWLSDLLPDRSHPRRKIPDSKALAAMFREVPIDIFVSNRTPNLQEEFKIRDAWEMRDEFLRIPAGPAEHLEFMQRWGEFREFSKVGPAKVVTLFQINSLRRTIASGMSGPTQDWLENHPWWESFEIVLGDCFPYPSWSHFQIDSALYATVTVDCWRGTRFSLCERHDCKLPFALTGRSDKRFCTNYCAHLTSVRKRASAKAAAKAAGRITAPRDTRNIKSKKKAEA